MTNTGERTIVELLCNCQEGNKWDIVAMQKDIVKAYGEKYVKTVKNKELQEGLEKALEYANEKELSIPKNINIGRFTKRMEATKATLEEKAEAEKNKSVSSEDIEKFEAEKAEFESEKTELQEDKDAFEIIKTDFIEEKNGLEVIATEMTERGEAVEAREVAVTEREKAVEAKETELANIPEAPQDEAPKVEETKKTK